MSFLKAIALLFLLASIHLSQAADWHGPSADWHGPAIWTVTVMEPQNDGSFTVKEVQRSEFYIDLSHDKAVARAYKAAGIDPTHESIAPTTEGEAIYKKYGPKETEQLVHFTNDKVIELLLPTLSKSTPRSAGVFDSFLYGQFGDWEERTGGSSFSDLRIFTQIAPLKLPVYHDRKATGKTSVRSVIVKMALVPDTKNALMPEGCYFPNKLDWRPGSPFTDTEHGEKQPYLDFGYTLRFIEMCRVAIGFANRHDYEDNYYFFKTKDVFNAFNTFPRQDQLLQLIRMNAVKPPQ